MDSDRSILLNTGARIPVIGLGTWKASRREVGQAVTYALTECGYRHVDCAPIYGNEPEIGEAFQDVFSGGKLRREEVFVTSKLWNSEHAPSRVRAACEKTLRDLKLDHLDLYLMHWGIASPAGMSEPLDENGILVTENIPIAETWKAMEELVRAGLVKAIGVANFTTMMLHDLMGGTKIPPAMNQIELHPYLQQPEVVKFCRSKDVAVTAYSPLGRPGYPETKQVLLEEGTIQRIAQMHGKTPTQIVLRWAIQRGTIPIPKSSHPAHIQENISVFDFELSPKDMESIAVLDKGFRFCDPREWWNIPYFN